MMLPTCFIFLQNPDDDLAHTKLVRCFEQHNQDKRKIFHSSFQLPKEGHRLLLQLQHHKVQPLHAWQETFNCFSYFKLIGIHH